MKDKTIDPEKFQYHSSVAEGLHDFLEREITSHSLKIISKNRGGVFFTGKKENLKNFFLSTRFSSKISFEIAKFQLTHPDELYDKTILIPWENFLSNRTTFKIESNTKDNLSHSRFAMYRLKDSILDRFRKKIGEEPQIEKFKPDILIILRSHQNYASISLSITPTSITNRGYRTSGGVAPLRENIAQAVLEFSGWENEEVIIDPMCGSGTILIEAALLLKNSHINIKSMNSSTLFNRLFGKAEMRNSPKPNSVLLFGYDKNIHAINSAIENAKNAGVEDWIRFENKDFSEVQNNFDQGYIITNPPYGERLEDKDSAKILYGNLSKFIKQNFKNFIFTIITGDKSLLGYLKLKQKSSLNLTIANWKAKIVNYEIN
ncbi:MAG: N-6 DNA methylase [Leptospiraceae bacterium]|nr:N-6 DNA methylase [Leptospiraceae bacterium]MCK6380559.1 N-6 DNA methylase [Leptospiraceae bacterium]NUM40730.1 N-6 DNA methylase [Leptospiraceae bacterium]